MSETATFIRHMNKWFDCLNTRHLYEGKDRLNQNASPFTDPEDPRLTYLSETFLGYFEEWKTSVDNRLGRYSRDERNKMQLSHQTLDGLKISVRSIVSCVLFLLKQGHHLSLQRGSTKMYLSSTLGIIATRKGLAIIQQSTMLDTQ